MQLFIVLIFLHLLVRDEISEGRASFHRGFDSLDAKILFRVNIIPILFPSYIIYRSNLFIFLEIFRRVKARIRSARDRREGEEEWEEEWEEGRGTKFIVRQTTRTSRRRKYPGAEEFVTTSAPRMLLFSSSLCVARWFRAVLSERPSASLMHAFRFFPGPGVNYSRSAKIYSSSPEGIRGRILGPIVKVRRLPWLPQYLRVSAL